MSEIGFRAYIEPCKQMIQDGKTIEDILVYLRKATKSKGDSGVVIMEVLNITPGEAKRLVYTSEAWKDVRERDEKFHEDIFSALENLDKDK